MNIIDKLKKKKKSGSVLDSLIKKKEPKADAEDMVQKKLDDIEVREITSSNKPVDSEEIEERTQPEEKPIREFRTEGMREFDIESLGVDSNANMKAEYKARITTLIDQDKIDEAMNLLHELKSKLTGEN